MHIGTREPQEQNACEGHARGTRRNRAIYERKPGVLTIYKNHPVGNFRHKHKTIKCEVAGERITIKYIHISKREFKEETRHFSKTTTVTYHFFLLF